ncbi:cardiolipin synthase [Fredinandcohnia quinoae]|uniref:Cardiolipin synthase n=1 Tax=Fredinandcohnia quinoae TaxID=2918902 RepID=A0AAW5E0T6_9BACI|nr:cardiolipin synthase [Fredinandcohnia sp. SECRCQ15]MCH1626228.1 cardiolipin synthase [Fredinandcohnia sp. SECRCQ15]
MKKTFQVVIFLIVISVLLFFTKNFWEGWLLGGFSIFITLSVIFISIIIFFENRHPTQTLTWLVVLGSFPLLGFFFYILFGRNFRKKRLFNRKALLDEAVYLSVEGNIDHMEEKIEQMGQHQRLLFRLAHKLGKSPISFATETRVLTNGDQTFTAIFDALQKATHHIHLEYYIVRDDGIGKQLKEILIERAKSGVEVRFLYDGVGSWQLSNSYIEELRNAGVEMIPFSPVKFPIFTNKVNYRNHRKIIVIDGSVGFIGGLNVGDEYIGKNEFFGFWRDTHLFVNGEAVRSMQLIFLQDWYYMTGKDLLTQTYLSPHLIEGENFGGVQLIAGGPDNEWEVIKNLFFSMIISAKKSIWIASPYFIPDDDILSALRVSALSGIDVRILIPRKPDKKIVYYASRSYFPFLLEAGVKIYEYEKGFMHSKIVIVDNELASIGTANMDMRSFHLNFEVNAFLYKTNSTDRLVSDYIQDIDNSSQIQESMFKKRSLWQRIFESLCRLLSPLL